MARIATTANNNTVKVKMIAAHQSVRLTMPAQATAAIATAKNSFGRVNRIGWPHSSRGLPNGSTVNSHTFISFTNAIQQTYAIQRAIAALRPKDAAALQRNAADYARRLRLIKSKAAQEQQEPEHDHRPQKIRDDHDRAPAKPIGQNSRERTKDKAWEKSGHQQ